MNPEEKFKKSLWESHFEIVVLLVVLLGFISILWRSEVLNISNITTTIVGNNSPDMAMDEGGQLRGNIFEYKSPELGN